MRPLIFFSTAAVSLVLSASRPWAGCETEEAKLKQTQSDMDQAVSEMNKAASDARERQRPLGENDVFFDDDRYFRYSPMADDPGYWMARHTRREHWQAWRRAKASHDRCAKMQSMKNGGQA